VLTDTTFWLDLIGERRARRRGPAHAFMAAHRANALRVSIVTWEELAEGVESSAVLDQILQQVRLLLMPKQVAWETSRIQRELDQRLGENDAWIAGTARAWGFRLVTRDRAFHRVQRLNLVRY
jgi:predicted nucleic acid-binding protein